MFLYFVTGVDVDYNYKVEDLEKGKTKVRCLVIAATCDYPGHCEIAKSIKGGQYPCRRDSLRGKSCPILYLSLVSPMIYNSK